AGIGTNSKYQFLTEAVSSIASMIDQAVAIHLNDHVKMGYKFLMQNYQHVYVTLEDIWLAGLNVVSYHSKGDKICLFGFSQGAYMARALAGMLYKVRTCSQQQLDFAFSIYQSTNMESAVQSQEFKETCCIGVKVDFLGVWDAVSSVGILTPLLPYSSCCYGVKMFRHALALDEHCARFRPTVWDEPPAKEELVDCTLPRSFHETRNQANENNKSERKDNNDNQEGKDNNEDHDDEEEDSEEDEE
ncbi:hypothetical protein JAAARDRAFT_87643, partial [Jaapia argillacea MUCL 33604]